MLIELKGKIYEVTNEFYLVNFPKEVDEDWMSFAMGVGDSKKITLEQRNIVIKLRDYYLKLGMPKMRDVVKITECPLKRMYNLFSEGPYTIAKMAGLPGKIC